MALYGFDDANCKHEVYSKEEVLALIEEALEGNDPRTISEALLIAPDKITEINASETASFWIGTSAQFAALGVSGGQFIGRLDENNNIYVLSDDTTITDINAELDAARERDSKWIELITAIEDLQENAITQISQNLFNNVYPIGALYMSTDATDPAELFGGTWERIKDKFILAAGDTYGAGTTGGAASRNVTLAVENLPSHTHTFSGTTASAGAHVHEPSIYNMQYDEQLRGNISLRGTGGNAGGTYGYLKSHGMASNYTYSAGAHTHTFSGTTGATGTATPINVQTMPPYLTAYVWKRTGLAPTPPSRSGGLTTATINPTTATFTTIDLEDFA